MRRGRGSVVVDDQQPDGIGDRIEQRAEKRLFARSKYQVSGNGRTSVGRHRAAVRARERTFRRSREVRRRCRLCVSPSTRRSSRRIRVESGATREPFYAGSLRATTSNSRFSYTVPSAFGTARHSPPPSALHAFRCARRRVRVATSTWSGIPPTERFFRRTGRASRPFTMRSPSAIPTPIQSGARMPRSRSLNRLAARRESSPYRSSGATSYAKSSNFPTTASPSSTTASSNRLHLGARNRCRAGLFEQRYILFVGDPIAEPRKNFALLYDAYRRAWPNRRASSTPALVVAGAQAPAWEGVVHAGNLGDDLAARNADEGLRALYRGALALALASYHETFGMPLLEAMACGTPVIASQGSSLPEIGGDAALYAPSDDADAWAAALRRITEDVALRDRLRIAGLDRATHFSWDESAALHLALFREVAGVP